jgi:nondiscriminating glutamyl-tRNA synthetase
MATKPVRVRIAPSPTGYLHVGIARTALYNWIFAKQHKGKLILRIEDTDSARSSEAFEEDILESLTWLGLAWDEGPYRQSTRTDIYGRYANELLRRKLAYHCFCTREDLESARQAMLAQGMAPKYSGKCRSMSDEEARAKQESGAVSVIRFKIPESRIQFTDMVRGSMSFNMALAGDIVIAKNPRSPLYNFAVAVDDAEMNISHVIRGEDHLSNTPKQILILRALGLHEPHYAHLPLILDPDRSKMSKRYSATAIREYRIGGFLPEALVNFLALLGWHPADDREIFTAEELTSVFDLARVQKAGAVFNLEKLNWMNSQYIRKLGEKELLSLIRAAGFLPQGMTEQQLLKAVSLVKERMRTIGDFSALADFFFALPNYPPSLLLWKTTSRGDTLESLEKALTMIQSAEPERFHAEHLQRIIAPLSDERGRGAVLWPLRVALSGKEASPGPFEIMEILEAAETIRRIDLAIKKLKHG